MSQFKAMKFWIGNDPKLYHKVRNIFGELGADLGEIWEHADIVAITKKGEFVSWTGCGMTGINCPDESGDGPYELIDIDWMRTPKKETIELNGKKYLKEDLTAEVGKQTVSALEEALKHLKPVG